MLHNRVWATKNAVHQSIAKGQRTDKKVLHVTFFDNKGPVMQLPVPKDRTVTGAFNRNIVLKKLNAHFKRRHPKTGLKYLRFLHDNASAHKAHIVSFFSLKWRMFFHIPLFHLTWLPVIISCFLNSKICLEKGLKSRNTLGSAVAYISYSWVCQFRTERCFQNWIDRLKRCIRADGEYFEEQRKVK